MWQKDRSADAAGRLENLKELVRSMQDFENLHGFLEHISLVMDRDRRRHRRRLSIMTLHSAKGLEFDTVFLPGWEEGLFPHQRSLDERAAPGWRKSAASPMSASRARASARRFISPPTAACTALVEQHPLALPRRIAGGACGGDGKQRRLRHERLRPLALRRVADLRLELRHARLAARAGARPKRAAAAALASSSAAIPAIRARR